MVPNAVSGASSTIQLDLWYQLDSGGPVNPFFGASSRSSP